LVYSPAIFQLVAEVAVQRRLGKLPTAPRLTCFDVCVGTCELIN